jgi:hypothetical protein
VAKYPNHVGQIDLTVVPTRAGFWTAWFPFSLPQIWPFAWILAFVVDQYTRRVLGFTLFTKEPLESVLENVPRDGARSRSTESATAVLSPWY